MELFKVLYLLVAIFSSCDAHRLHPYTYRFGPRQAYKNQTKTADTTISGSTTAPSVRPTLVAAVTPTIAANATFSATRIQTKLCCDGSATPDSWSTTSSGNVSWRVTSFTTSTWNPYPTITPDPSCTSSMLHHREDPRLCEMLQKNYYPLGQEMCWDDESSDDTMISLFFSSDFTVTWNTKTEGCGWRQFSADVASVGFAPGVAEYANVCHRAFCMDLLWEAYSRYEDSGSTEWTTETKTQWQNVYTTLPDTTQFLSQSYQTITSIFIKPPLSALQVPAPCCGQCTLTAETVQLFFWPEETTVTPSVTGLPDLVTASIFNLPTENGVYIDGSNFTFISPSIYIGFTSLWATDRCGYVGSPIVNSTLAFHPDEISTIPPRITRDPCTITTYSTEINSGSDWYEEIWNWTLVTTEDIVIASPVPIDYAHLVQNCSTIAGYSYFPNNPDNAFGDYDPCHPIIAIPDRVKELQAGWSLCVPGGNGGFYDPPVTLHQGLFLIPTAAPQSRPSPAPQTTDGIAPPLKTPESLAETNRPPVPAQNPPDPPTSVILDPVDSRASDISASPGDDSSPASAPPPIPHLINLKLPGSSTTVTLTPAAAVSPIPSPVHIPDLPVITLRPVPNSNGPVSIAELSSSRSLKNPIIVGSTVENVITLTPVVIASPVGAASLTGASITVLVIGSQTLEPGHIITVGGLTSVGSRGVQNVVSGTQISMDPQGTALIVERTSTIAMAALLAKSDPDTNREAAIVGDAISSVTIGNTVFTIPSVSGPLTIGSTVLTPGQKLVISGTTLVLNTGASMLVVGTSTIVLKANAPAPTTLTIGNTIITLSPVQGALRVGTATLLPGSTLIESGTTLSLAPGASELVIDRTSTISLRPNAPILTARPLLVVLDGTTLTADSNSRFVFGDKTLSIKGPAITVNGTTYTMTTDEGDHTLLIAGTADVDVAPSTTATGDEEVESMMSAMSAKSATRPGLPTSTNKTSDASITSLALSILIVSVLLSLVILH